jgi:GxxExxY protein
VQLPIQYKGVPAGTYLANFVVEEKVIIEIKAVSQLNDTHKAQAIHYLAATGYGLALLLNFGAVSLQTKRIVR